MSSMADWTTSLASVKSPRWTLASMELAPPDLIELR